MCADNDIALTDAVACAMRTLRDVATSRMQRASQTMHWREAHADWLLAR
jgi:hypothetical protein